MPNDVVSRAIDAVCAGDHLTADHASAVLAEIMEGRTDPVQTGAFLIALRAKGETVPELVGLARTMRSLAAPVSSSRADLVDTAGTGGGPSTFNVSTTAALVAAGAGCAVAKHGNRSNTSKCGSADLLEALGVDIELEPEQVGRCIDEIGFGFMFAPRHHAAMAHVIPARKALGVRTIFNFLGPLTNPAGANRQLLGVADRHYQETIAEALVGLGSVRALVVSAEDGLDELSIAAPHAGDRGRRRWHLGVVRRGAASSGSPRPSWRRSPAARRRRTQRPCAACWPASPGPRRDLTLLNAAAAIYVGGLADRPRRGRRQGCRGDRLRRGRKRAGSADRGDRRARRLGSGQFKWA